MRPEKLDYFAPGPGRSAPQIAEIFSETATTGGRMVNKSKQRPCDDVSEDIWCRICRNPNMRAKKPCEGPLPETSEAEPSRSCSSPTFESTAAVTTRSGRIIVEPTRLAEDDDDVEQQRPRARLSRSTVEATGPRHQGRPDRGADRRSERAARAIDQGARRIAHGHGHAHARDEGNGGHLKAINGKRIAAETSLEKLRDKEIGSSQSVRQKAFMSNFFAAKRCVQACTTEASTSTMEAATSAPAVGYTVEQVRAQQNDRIFRRAVQNLHVQIIEVTGEHARTHGR